jgi:hypothetical protein
MVMILAYGSLETEWRKSGENEKPGENGRKYKNSREIPIDVKLFLDHNQTAQETAQYE